MPVSVAEAVLGCQRLPSERISSASTRPGARPLHRPPRSLQKPVLIGQLADWREAVPREFQQPGDRAIRFARAVALQAFL
eukprot:CAMPEP_0168482020 /NCGR_PEP_ID=MMETSP0228-20121227/64816_1 /TAXON_ID=133427 /ORGANISM="Protoceratium reticulatum, Strain CCCM 535 (=CCMP 1889)" /LENGTH=79 /DNA_ID=CAMNT_0008498415 /DNA_START=43 /DNA_END=282 /DNA_ORIENTATION=+